VRERGEERVVCVVQPAGGGVGEGGEGGEGLAEVSVRGKGCVSGKRRGFEVRLVWDGAWLG